MSNTSNDSNGYRIVRLVNGEKLIAKITGSDKNKLFLERPMVIEGIVGTESINPIMVVKKEYLILQNWIEFCKNNVVGIPKNHILTIYAPDELLTNAYNMQKEREDTGGGDNDITSLLPDDLNLSEMLENSCFGDDPSNMDISDIVSDIVSDIINGNIQNFKFKYEEDVEKQPEDEEWNESCVDKDRNNYGNELDDWSPYIEDYFNNNDDSSTPPSH